MDLVREDPVVFCKQIKLKQISTNTRYNKECVNLHLKKGREINMFFYVSLYYKMYLCLLLFPCCLYLFILSFS